MRIAFVDIQGFDVGGVFRPKELAINVGCQTNHFLFKPPVPFKNLSAQDRKSAYYVEKNVHGISYSSGYVEYSELQDIINKYILLTSDLVYVRGEQKQKFLQKIIEEIDENVYLNIIDVCQYDGSLWETGNFKNSRCACLNHGGEKFMCALNNIQHLVLWFNYCVLPAK